MELATESKSEKFIRIAEKRLDNAVVAVRRLGGLSNTSNYQFNETDVEKLVSVLRVELNELEALFNARLRKQTRTKLR